MKCAKPGRAIAVLIALAVVACQAGGPMGAARSISGAQHTTKRVPRTLVGTVASASEVLRTAAPQPAKSPDPLLEELLTSCGEGDRTLHRAAAKLLTHELLKRPLDNTSLTFAVRTSGGPYVKPRGLRLHQTTSGDPSAFAAPMLEWLSTLEPSPERRCGIASSTRSESGYWLSVVTAEARADLEPLPTRVDPGTRVHFLAQLLDPGTQAALVVLGPVGPPREILPSLSGERVEASFFLDMPGLHRIQLMVDEAGGPGAAIEAWVGVGQPLPTTVDAGAAPGETIPVDSTAPEQAMLDMLNAARASEGLSPLEADPLLRELAEQHAAAMQQSERLEHDLGDGNPRWRLEAGGVHAATAGENIARAPTLARAHRAIWASPSHRANLLNPHFDKVGIGVEQGPSGEWWVCELLADLR